MLHGMWILSRFEKKKLKISNINRYMYVDHQYLLSEKKQSLLLDCRVVGAKNVTLCFIAVFEKNSVKFQYSEIFDKEICFYSFKLILIRVRLLCAVHIL